ncbi:hypothetical protein [Acidimangrovimonas sediminis]|uniref:hypothetical protein n=1 Tax=Acidimangrovimonas sediminis TaxID=2056283 RepID=UPI000C7FA007|nr:hypothetical protein [Acidimangrovimonas sediminis]
MPASDLTLTRLQISQGVWSGRLSGPATPDGGAPLLSVTHLDQPVPGIRVIPERDGGWTVSVPIPASALSDGVQTVLIRDALTGARLASFAIMTGEPLEDDIRAEVDLLRAELDMLKKAFRRHCTETAG